MIEAEQIEAIPEQHRRLIAQWLLERVAQYQPSWLLPQWQVALLCDAISGVAVDLMRPVSDDSTLDYAAEVLHDLAGGT